MNGHLIAAAGMAALSLAQLAATAATPPAPAEFARYADAVLGDAFAADASGVAVLVMRGDETLSGQIKGQPQGVPLAATSPTRFTADAVGAELTFAPETGPAKTVTLRQGGQTLEFERMPAAK